GRFGPRRPVLVGVIGLAASAASCAYFTAETAMVVLMLPQFLRGAASSLLTTATGSAAMNSVPRNRVSTGTSVIGLALHVGGATGTILVSIALSWASTLSGSGDAATHSAFRIAFWFTAIFLLLALVPGISLADQQVRAQQP